jgi:aspartate racemase
MNIILSSHATTPDRTAYILGESDESPLSVMVEEAQKLEKYGADLLVMPCNTAHYFYDSIRCSVNVPMLNIVNETLALCAALGKKRVGLLATDGTVETRTYQRRAGKIGLECVLPDAEDQRGVMHLIYGQIKKGLPADMELFQKLSRDLLGRGCDAIILGCTELSLIGKTHTLDKNLYVDSLEALASAAILACGKKTVGFHFPQASVLSV